MKSKTASKTLLAVALLMALTLASGVSFAQEEAAPEAAPEERSVTMPWTRRAPADDRAPSRDGTAIGASNIENEKMAGGTEKHRFYVPMVTGDKEKVEKLQLWKDWAEYITFNEVTTDEISAFRDRLLKALQEEGYVFASVEIPTPPWGQGFFVALVDCGPLGNVTVKNAGTYYSQSQIIEKLSNREDRFNYAVIRNQLADLNNGGDVKVDATLKPVIRHGRRYIDAEVEYEDSLPIHGGIEINNSTSREAESNVRIRATLQDTNLTKHNDVLSLGYITDGDIADSVNGFFGTYALPLNEYWTFGMLATWCDSASNDVSSDMDVVGRGYSLGLQLERELYADADYRFTAAVGVRMAKTKNHLDVKNIGMNLNSAKVVMPYVTIGFSQQRMDAWNGRTFATLTLSGNKADKLGASTERRFIAEGRNADGTFVQLHGQAARIQRLFDGEDEPGRWTLFAKTDFVYSDDTVPAVVRQYLGGYTTVRGYNECELGGDNVISGTLELRTPLLENFIPGLTQDEEQQAADPDFIGKHRLQGLVFVDAGYISSNDYKNLKVNGYDAQATMLSAGVGLRLGVTKYAQAAIDYGMPVIKHVSRDTPKYGRFHLSLQLQF